MKPLVIRLHREFNISAAEIDANDQWQYSVIGCSIVSNSRPHAERTLRKVTRWVETHWPDVAVIDDRIELY